MAIVYYSKDLNEMFLVKLKEEIKDKFSGCKKIAVKIHFGEPGNKYAFVPGDIKPITDLLKELEIGFFLYDTSVAYGGPRSNPRSHYKVALEKGWGELGEVKIDGGFVKKKEKNLVYEVGKPLTEADGVLVISHIKGHVCTGFGGAIKNLGMGALSKKSKRDIHVGGEPEIVGECQRCLACEKACPINGIKVTRQPEFKICYGCSNCIYVCPYGVLKPKINYFDVLLAEGAKAAQSKFKKVYYLSFLKNITKKCDCEANPGKIIAEDSGFLFSEDGVAIDKAAYDIITNKMGDDVFLKFNKKSGLEQIEAAEKLGRGRKQYQLNKF